MKAVVSPFVSTFASAAVALAVLAACGGSNPLDNPDTIDNPSGASGQKLSFAYYQRCINPIFLAQLTINQNGARSINTCASAGCHDNTNGTGGALRLTGSAPEVDLGSSANTPDVIRTSDMYKNFYSAQGEVVFGSPTQSRLVTKPLLLGVLHGGGLIFESQDDPNVRKLAFWINRPMPQGQDEFSSAAASMFDAQGECLSE
jgi:hypothetical protein